MCCLFQIREFMELLRTSNQSQADGLNKKTSSRIAQSPWAQQWGQQEAIGEKKSGNPPQVGPHKGKRSRQKCPETVPTKSGSKLRICKFNYFFISPLDYF